MGTEQFTKDSDLSVYEAQLDCSSIGPQQAFNQTDVNETDCLWVSESVDLVSLEGVFVCAASEIYCFIGKF